jgi:hypothetical protein
VIGPILSRRFAARAAFVFAAEALSRNPSAAVAAALDTLAAAL